MASTGMKGDDCRPASQAPPPKNDGINHELCELCLRALTINDQLSDGTSTVDASGFKFYLNEMITDLHSGFRQRRPLSFPSDAKVDASGWTDRQSHPEQYNPTRRYRRFCGGDQHERVVTLPSMPEISVSAVGGCRFCSRLRALFIDQYAEYSWWNEHGSTLSFTIQYEWTQHRTIPGGEHETEMPAPSQSLDGLAVIVSFPGRESYTVDVYQFDVVAWPGPCQEWLSIKITPLDPDGPVSDRNIGFMRQCIDECMSNHENCKKKSSKPVFVPKRLLDLGDCNASSARLKEYSQIQDSTAHPETQLQYATLSYCWGQSLTVKTTTANKSEHETIGIKVQRMPATFQDAIRVTKKLEMRYLWIDALCIVQDDKDDWEAEAITMCDIFAHSRVTISAGNSSSSADHFLQRPVDETLTLDFHSTRKPEYSGRYSIRLEPRHVKPANEDTVKTAWVSRAWVWQEEIMSARQVVFGNKTVQFRCGNGTSIEDGRWELNDLMTAYRYKSYWLDFVETYSSRRLTYASDRLKAIAGVAKYIERLHHMEGEPTEYLAGLWKNNDFYTQLKWVCSEPASSYTELIALLQDRGRYIAPSWSWASRNGAVRCPRGDDDDEVTFRVIKSDLRASNKSAMVSVAFGSSITLSGKLSQIPVEPSSGDPYPDPNRSLHVPDPGRGIYPDSWEVSSAFGETSFCLDWFPKKDDDEESKFQRQLCLFVTDLLEEFFECPTKSIRYASGLVLAPVLDTELKVLFYYRVGTFSHEGDWEWLMDQPEREITIR